MLKHSAADWWFYREGDHPYKYYRKLKKTGNYLNNLSECTT
jgi:hypothetical protein